MAEPTRCYANCKHLGRYTREMFPPNLGLGDYVSDALGGIGITKARWTSLVTAYKKEAPTVKNPGCGCKKRESLLNYAGRKLGLSTGQGSDLRVLLSSIVVRKQPMFKCSLHGTCIGLGEIFNEEVSAAIDAIGIKRCCCENFEDKRNGTS